MAESRDIGNTQELAARVREAPVPALAGETEAGLTEAAPPGNTGLS